MHVAGALRERFAKVMEARAAAGDSVEAGRAYVAAYTEYLDYVETIHRVFDGEVFTQHK